MISRKKYENPYIHDKDGRSVVNREQIYRIINSHFQTHFKDEAEKLEPFEGNPRKLDSPITKEEVMKSVTKLNNN